MGCCNNWKYYTAVCEQIQKELSRYGKLIAFWNGIKLAELIYEYFYEEFIKVLKLNEQEKSSSITWWDPKSPNIIVDNEFNSTKPKTIELTNSGHVPINATEVFITIDPLDGNFPHVECAVWSVEDETIVVDSFLSQISPFPVKIKYGLLNFMLIKNARPVKILVRGYRL